MKKSLLALIALFCMLAGQRIFAKGYIIRKDGKRISADSIVADSRGNLTYESDNFKMKIKRGDYKDAFVEKPGLIKKAEQEIRLKNLKDAARLFGEAYDRYKYLGWDAYCLYYQGRCLYEGDRKAEAVERLALLEEVDIRDPGRAKYYFMGMQYLAKAYVDLERYADAIKTLEKLAKADNQEITAFSFNLKGEILEKQGKKRAAVFEYMKTVLLAPIEIEHREQALFKVASLMQSMNDPRADEFRESLRTEYPDSRYLQQL